MKKSLTAIAALVVAGALSGPAMAQDMPFAEVDADSNGSLTFAEVTAKHSAVSQEQFDQVDANGDDMLSEEEYTALLALATGSATDGDPSKTNLNPSNSGPNASGNSPTTPAN